MENHGTCYREKHVHVAVYVEKPIKRRPSKNNNKNHHHRIRQQKIIGNYNRRAELLRYSHHLRESAKSTKTSSSPDPLKSLAVSITEQLPPPLIIPSEKEEKVKKHQACFEWVSLLKFNNEKKITTKGKKNMTKSFLYKLVATFGRFR
ncbi:hypothetical protein LXL04_000845 [Taraxacum kok-saghyz]